jgi:hypothetical protein
MSRTNGGEKDSLRDGAPRRALWRRMNVNLSPEILQQTPTSPTEKRCLSFLSLDGADRREAAFTRRLERLLKLPTAQARVAIIGGQKMKWPTWPLQMVTTAAPGALASNERQSFV